MKTDMHPEELRRFGHEAVDWIADYLAGVRDLPVLPGCQPGDLIDRLPASAPEKGEPMEAILEDFRRLIVPATTHWNHPRFHAYFSISGSGPGILAEMLIAALNVNGMVWKSSPAATELEQVTLGWLRQWIGLPEEFFGIIYDTASISSMHAIAAARHMADPEVRARGHSRPLVLYTSEQAHSSIEKGALAIGVGQQNVCKVPVDAEFRMDPEALRGAIRRDRDAGLQPFCVAATVGTTSTTSIDPVPEIAAITQEYGLWLHIDAAYGGVAAVAPEFRHVLAGAGRADSIVVNPHKWLFTPIDLSAFYIRRPEVLRQAFSLVPEYLRTAEHPRAVNFMDYGLQLGRRFRSLKLWFIMRYFGREGAAGIIRTHIGWARELAARIETDPGFELAAPVPFSVVCFRYKGSDDDNRRLLDSVNSSGVAFLSHTVLNGRFVLRFAIGHVGTTAEDVQTSWEAIRAAARNL